MNGNNIIKTKCECGDEISLVAQCSAGRVGLCPKEHGNTGWRLITAGANGQGISLIALKTKEQKKWGIWESEGGDNTLVF